MTKGEQNITFKSTLPGKKYFKVIESVRVVPKGEEKTHYFFRLTSYYRESLSANIKGLFKGFG